jgi:hypothetical protein
MGRNGQFYLGARWGDALKWGLLWKVQRQNRVTTKTWASDLRLGVMQEIDHALIWGIEFQGMDGSYGLENYLSFKKDHLIAEWRWNPFHGSMNLSMGFQWYATQIILGWTHHSSPIHEARLELLW